MEVEVFTIGHGTRSLEELGLVLHEAGIQRLIDVRRYPASRRNPHLAQASLERALPRQGVVYDWRGNELGGRRHTKKGVRSRHPAWRVDAFRAYADYMDSREFRDALTSLERDARREKIAIMCAETLWWRCHRRLIADALTVDGFAVTHLLAAGKREPHRLHEALRVDEQGRPVYDAGAQTELF